MRKILCALLFVGSATFLSAQHIGLKTNTLFLGTGSPNIGIEFGIDKQFSLNTEGSYNPFSFGTDKYWKHWFVQPELRWWYCHRYAGSFWGLHGFYGEYNASIPKITQFRYEGNLYGAGLSYGYSWILSNKWNIESVIGVGFARMKYDKYECGDCGEKLGTYERNYIGPTRAAISLIYFIH